MTPVYKVKIPKSVMEKAEKAREDLGLTYTKLFERLIEFFAESDDVTQSLLVIRFRTESRQKIARMLLESLINRPGHKGEHEK